MAQLTKYGAHLIAVTQSLELLDANAPALRPQVLANTGSLVSFALMSDDAKMVSPQFGGEVDQNDLLNLLPRHCFAKVSAGGQRQPTFSMSTRQLADADPALAEARLAYSAQQRGTPADQLEQARQKRAQLLQQDQKAQVKTHYDR